MTIGEGVSVECVTQQLAATIASLLDADLIDGRSRAGWREKPLEAIAKTLVRDEIIDVDNLHLELGRVAEYGGGTKPFCVAVPSPHRFLAPANARWDRFGASITCFVGHRFTSEFRATIRANVMTVLAPLDIRIVTSDDSDAGEGTLASIATKIRNCDMAIFDNAGTDRRPNVFMELGIAVGAKTPFYFLDHEGAAFNVEGGRVSNLKGVIRIPYGDCETAMRRLMVSLPKFLIKHRLAKSVWRTCLARCRGIRRILPGRAPGGD